MKKRILSLALALVLVVGLMPVVASANAGAQKVADKAKSYYEWANYSTFAGNGFHDGAWCGDFLYFCAEQSGEGAAMGGYMGQMSSVYDAANYFATDAVQFGVFGDAVVNDIRNHGRYSVNSSHKMNKADYTPKIGDIIFYDWNSGGTDIDHVEIVTAVSGHYITTVGGNTGSSCQGGKFTTLSYHVCCHNVSVDDTWVTAFARPKYSDTAKPVESTISTPAPATPTPSGTTKTQYRYHRYEDNSGEYAVCAYWGNVTYNTTMHIAYTDWLDAPLPEVKQGYVNFLEHPNQGVSCTNAGCLPSDPFEVHRHVDANGKVWYYEETRTVAAETTSTPTPATPAPTTPTPAPATPTPEISSKPTSTTTPEPEVTPSAKPSETVTPPPSEKPSEKPSEPSATPSAEPTQSDEQGTLPLPSTRAYVPDLFWDVKGDDWFYGNVADAYAMGLMNGTGASAFSPRNNMTLAEVVTLAARIHSLYHNGKESFSRYDGGSWYDPYVDYARENRIIDVNYDYTRPATREEFVHILAKALPEKELENIAGTVSFADSRDIVYVSDVRLLSGAGVINGVPEEGKIYFKPNATITRAEVAAVVARMAQPSSRISK